MSAPYNAPSLSEIAAVVGRSERQGIDVTREKDWLRTAMAVEYVYLLTEGAYPERGLLGVFAGLDIAMDSAAAFRRQFVIPSKNHTHHWREDRTEFEHMWFCLDGCGLAIEERVLAREATP